MTPPGLSPGGVIHDPPNYFCNFLCGGRPSVLEGSNPPDPLTTALDPRFNYLRRTPTSDRRTDRRTDKRTQDDNIYRASIASRVKKNPHSRSHCLPNTIYVFTVFRSCFFLHVARTVFPVSLSLSTEKEHFPHVSLTMSYNLDLRT